MKRILIILASLIVLFEEWVWEGITGLVAWLARFRLVARLEAWVQTLSPRATVALFAVPLLALLPAKILALYFLTHGKVLRGVFVILLAKGIGTAVSARLFVLAKPKLMTFTSFVWVYSKVIRLKIWAHDLLESTVWYGIVRDLLRSVKQRLRMWRNEARQHLRQWRSRFFG